MFVSNLALGLIALAAFLMLSIGAIGFNAFYEWLSEGRFPPILPSITIHGLVQAGTIILTITLVKAARAVSSNPVHSTSEIMTAATATPSAASDIASATTRSAAVDVSATYVTVGLVTMMFMLFLMMLLHLFIVGRVRKKTERRLEEVVESLELNQHCTDCLNKYILRNIAKELVEVDISPSNMSENKQERRELCLKMLQSVGTLSGECE